MLCLAIDGSGCNITVDSEYEIGILLNRCYVNGSGGVMEPHQLASVILFFAGILVGIGLLFGLVAAFVFFFED